jgi:2,3-diketo-5-methylthio-1-phosphopentane phosphatase
MELKKSQVLIAFDMDDTILNGNTCTYPVRKFLNSDSKGRIKDFYIKNKNLVDLQQFAFDTLKQDVNISIGLLRETISEIKLTHGFRDLFDFIEQNKSIVQPILITGNNSIIVDWVTKEKNLEDFFLKTYHCHAEIIESENSFIKCSSYHIHNCSVCEPSQCKGRILKEHIEENVISNDDYIVVYVGDGENDFCPSTTLRSIDYLFPRKNYMLHKLISNKENCDKLSCSIFSWENGLEILEHLKSILSNNNKLFNIKF